MAEGKDPALSQLEQSLINFLTQKKEVEEQVAGGARRVRGLTMGLDLRDEKKPCFSVQIGMCEAVFNINSGLKEKGNCFGLERYIIDWFSRPSVNHELKMVVAAALKKK